MKRAVLIDALGTLLWMRPPWEEIDPELVAGIDPGRLRAAFAAEIAYYREHLGEGSDPERLRDLRRRCASVLSAEAGVEIGVSEMLEAIRFEPFADAAPALLDLRAEGMRTVCVSNWDCSLPEVLERAGLGALLDGVVASASSGSSKPDPSIFEAALELAGCGPSEALHVGDSTEDVEGARAAGIEVLRIDRGGSGGAGDEGRIASLAEIRQHLAARA